MTTVGRKRLDSPSLVWLIGTDIGDNMAFKQQSGANNANFSIPARGNGCHCRDVSYDRTVSSSSNRGVGRLGVTDLVSSAADSSMPHS